MAELTVGAGYARGLLELAVAQGANRGLLLERAGLDPDMLADQDARVPFEKYKALMRAGKALSGDPALALHYGERVAIADVSIAGLISLAATSMDEAMAQLNRFVPLIIETEDPAPGARFALVRDRDGRLWFTDRRLHANDFPELTETAFAQFICGPRRIGLNSYARAVEVTHADPGNAAEFVRIAGCPVTFGAERNAFQVDDRIAQLRLTPKIQPYVFGVLSERAQRLLGELKETKTVRGQVESLIMPVLHTGDASMDAVAERMGLSRQTLFRKLKAEGVTFEKVLDELRRRLALDYLNGRKVSVYETAYLTGFSEPAAFSRAFKRWTGMSPSEARALAASSAGQRAS